MGPLAVKPAAKSAAKPTAKAAVKVRGGHAHTDGAWCHNSSRSRSRLTVITRLPIFINSSFQAAPKPAPKPAAPKAAAKVRAYIFIYMERRTLDA